MKIESRDNQRLKNARKTREGKFGDRIFIEGLRLAEECLKSDLLINEVFFSSALSQNERITELINALSSRCVEIFEVSDQLLNSLSDTKNSQGIVLIGKKPETGKFVLENALTKTTRKFSLFVLLHEINNPSNLGAIMRTSEAANVSGIILTEKSADVFAPKSLRASMGAAFRVPIWNKTGFSEALKWARGNGLSPVCADVNAELSYLDIDWKKPRLLIFGSEAHGLNAAELEQIDENFLIPMDNNVESLNLAVAAGIVLFEAKRSVAC